MDLINVLSERRTALGSEMDQLLAAPTTERRDLNAEETTQFEALNTEARTLDGRLTQLREADERNRTAAAALAAGGQTGERRAGGAVVTAEAMTYDRHTRNSYFLDLARAHTRGDSEAMGRLQRHARELDVELPLRERRREELAREELRGVEHLPERYRESVFERETRTNPNRTDGTGGYFVPPVWLMDEYIDLPRFGRQTANLCRQLTLPSGTDSINMPKVSTGTATAVQTADAASVASTDLTDTSVNAPVRTIAGQQDIAMQLLDQSPVGFDQVVFADLIADYNQRLDVQVINGSGSSGQCTGILNVASVNAVTYTDASPTLPELYVPLAQAASLVEKNRKMPAQAAVMIPSLWYWATAQLDTTNRPLIVPPSLAWNASATQQGLASEGPAGMLSLGLPVYTDGNVPSNLGGGTNETRVIVARFSDLYLWEGSLQTRALTEVLSGTMQVRLQVYAYFAFMGNRRPESISVISGTGVIPTSGY